MIIHKALNIEHHNDGQDQDHPTNTIKQEEPKTRVNKIQTSNKGKLKLDATVADQMIVYPTDVGLLNCARMELERMIDLLYYKSKRTKKPRTYRRIARWQYLFFSKKKKKHKKTIRTAHRQQLNYVRLMFDQSPEEKIKPLLNLGLNWE